MTRDVAYVCFPCYGPPEPSASKQFWARCTDPKGAYKDMERIQDDMGGSLLAYTFNQHWARALTLQAAGSPIKWFAMLHSDISPQDWWLDMLLEDLIGSGADLMAATMPIKDERGLTSVAIDDPTNRWKVLRRLTTNELGRLPMVFGNTECGYPDNMLLANTGLWICDLTKPWRHAENEDGSLKVFFDINDRIMTVLPENNKDPNIKHKMWVAENASEDWNFSRRIGALGGKVMCTRRISAIHWGKMPYPNNAAWGHEFDKDVLGAEAQPICQVDGQAYIQGWLKPDEAEYLGKLAEGKVVLEIGSYCGLSTICLAGKAKSVVAVDPFDGRGTALPRNTYPEFAKNIEQCGLKDKVNVVMLPIEDAADALPDDFDLVFVDGAHDFYSVLRDARIARTKLKDNGVLVFHDYSSSNDKDRGVRQAVDVMLAGGGELLEVVNTMAVVRPENRARREIHAGDVVACSS